MTTKPLELAFLSIGQAAPNKKPANVDDEEPADVVKLQEQIKERAINALDLEQFRIIISGSGEELSRTVNAQQKVVYDSYVSAMSFRMMLKPYIINGVVTIRESAGHSAGSTAALVNAGAISFENGLIWNTNRGHLMEESRKGGGLIAVTGIDEYALDEICQQTGANIATINTKHIMTVAGNRKSLANTADFVSHRGGKYSEDKDGKIVLLSRYQFHRPEAVGKVAINFSKWVADNKDWLKKPEHGFRSYVNGNVLITKSAILAELTSLDYGKNPITARVNWDRGPNSELESVIQGMIDSGLTNFVSLHPVISNWLRGREGITVLNAYDPAVRRASYRLVDEKVREMERAG